MKMLSKEAELSSKFEFALYQLLNLRAGRRNDAKRKAAVQTIQDTFKEALAYKKGHDKYLELQRLLTEVTH
jgi:hypothetical protein